MDLSTDGTSNRPQNEPGGRAPEGRPSVEARSTQPGIRLQKKRSTAGVRRTTELQPAGSSNATQRESTDARESNKARKGSLRNAVRRIFGRRSRDGTPETSQVSPPRHGYHKSEPSALAPQPEEPEFVESEDGATQRVFSAPFELVPSPTLLRARSPYAVEFPQSSRLKPLNLGSPFSAPGSQLRRRKTLPSVLIAGPEAAAVSAAVGSSEGPDVPGADLDEDMPPGEIGRALSTNESERRRSRSAENLRISGIEPPTPPRERSEELRYWRESFQHNVLRASGFTVPTTGEDTLEEREGDETPLARTEDPFQSRAGPSGTSPQPQRGLDIPEQDFTSPSALGSQLSQDIEDRVARLEAGLLSFQGELAQLAADRNRRTVLIGGAPASSLRRRASSGGRTASMLADTLQSDLEPSTYQYDYSDTLRPSTSPQPPRTPPVRHARPSAAPAAHAAERAADDPFTSTPSPPRTAPEVVADLGNGGNRSQQPPQYTFRSLYEMLADERSARRRLEMQMRGLREEIANLHYQVSVGSNVQSQRSSYYAAMDPMVGSSRLHALLRETEDSRPGTGQPEQQHQAGATGVSMGQRVVSRFSGSESEAGMAESEIETPYEAYQTPVEEQSRFSFAGRQGGTQSESGGMF